MALSFLACGLNGVGRGRSTSHRISSDGAGSCIREYERHGTAGCRLKGLQEAGDPLSGWRGPGTLWQDFPREVSADDGPIGSGATYSTLEIGGHRAVLECHPLTGRALSVAIAPDSTLTFETDFEDVELEAFALAFLEQLGDPGER